MQRVTTLTLILVGLFVCHENYSKIINGYDSKLPVAERSLNNLWAMSMVTLEPAGQKKLKRVLQKAEKEALRLRTLHRKTQVLIEMLSMIDPVLYHEISVIKDQDGNDTDVYIKAVEGLSAACLGVTNLAQCPEHPNAYTSEYGDHSVSVIVVYRVAVRAILILVHELGHVKYQIPNLASYVRYYEKEYLNRYIEGQVGHGIADPSHRSVKKTLNAFRRRWKAAVEERKILGRNNSQEIMAFVRQQQL